MSGWHTSAGKPGPPASRSIAGAIEPAGAPDAIMVTATPTAQLGGTGAALEPGRTPDAFVAGDYLPATSPGTLELQKVPPQAVPDQPVGKAPG